MEVAIWAAKSVEDMIKQRATSKVEVGKRKKFEGTLGSNKKKSSRSLVQGNLEEDLKRSVVRSARRSTLGNVTEKSHVINVKSLSIMTMNSPSL